MLATPLALFFTTSKHQIHFLKIELENVHCILLESFSQLSFDTSIKRHLICSRKTNKQQNKSLSCNKTCHFTFLFRLFCYQNFLVSLTPLLANYHLFTCTLYTGMLCFIVNYISCVCCDNFLMFNGNVTFSYFDFRYTVKHSAQRLLLNLSQFLGHMKLWVLNLRTCSANI